MSDMQEYEEENKRLKEQHKRKLNEKKKINDSNLQKLEEKLTIDIT